MLIETGNKALDLLIFICVSFLGVCTGVIAISNFYDWIPIEKNLDSIVLTLKMMVFAIIILFLLQIYTLQEASKQKPKKRMITKIRK